MTDVGERWRRPVWWTGIALVLVGALIGGYVGWQLVVTTWLSQREQREVVAAVERVWGDLGGRAAEDDVRLASDVVAVVRVPAFGADYAIPAYEGTDDAVLARGFGIDAGRPGEVGNLVLAGHRITHGEPLRELPNLQAGDEVVVETATTTYTYVLDTDGDALTVDLDDIWVTEPVPVPPDGVAVRPTAAGDRLLTLVTCAELFHTDDRLVAFGRLVSEQSAQTARNSRR